MATHLANDVLDSRHTRVVPRRALPLALRLVEHQLVARRGRQERQRQDFPVVEDLPSAHTVNHTAPPEFAPIVCWHLEARAVNKVVVCALKVLVVKAIISHVKDDGIRSTTT